MRELRVVVKRINYKPPQKTFRKKKPEAIRSLQMSLRKKRTQKKFEDFIL